MICLRRLEMKNTGLIANVCNIYIYILGDSLKRDLSLLDRDETTFLRGFNRDAIKTVVYLFAI